MHHQTSYSQKVLIRIASSKATLTLMLNGAVAVPRLTLEPALLDFGAMMPGQGPLKATANLVNSSDFPIEVRRKAVPS
jgi:hypothetical protein